MRGDHAHDRVAHAVEQIVVRDVAGADHLDARLVEAALDVLLHEVAARARRHEDEQRVGLGVGLPSAGPARSRGCAAARAGSRRSCRRRPLNFSLEGLLGVDAGRVVAGQGHDLLDAVLDRPVGHRHGRLRQREAGAHDIGRAPR